MRLTVTDTAGVGIVPRAARVAAVAAVAAAARTAGVLA